MKLMSYQHQGRTSYGAVKGDGVVDLGRRLGAAHPTLRALIAAGALAEARRILEREAPDHRLSEVSFLPVITDPEKIIAIGLNYADHAAEANLKVPDKPVVFTRFADSHVGHGQALVKPKESDKYDYEVELCIIIGKPARRVAAKDALGHVAGYSIYHDGSVRDWQFHSSQFIPGKNFPGSGAVGPWLVTADELPDPSSLGLTSKINGQLLQNGNTKDMIFPVEELISYCSRFTELRPGDMIASGTPPGVGFARKPPLFMKVGDLVEMEIERIGVLSNRVTEG
jgi:2-keto-4-pentenoate hydratase/2-oxohepta-3-ene-1,7-dioic acid hydratase in catechol pathway